MTTTTTRRVLARLRRYLRGEGLSMAFQPITDLDSGKVIGFESLARFDGLPPRSPAAWFKDAGDAGLRQRLELATARAAMASLQHLPEDAYLTINASPDVAMMPAFLEVVSEAGSRLVVEITEHAPIDDYDALNRSLDRLRSHGIRVAIDDAGAGFANVTHLLRINAEIIKLDVEITRDVDLDVRRKAMVGSLVEFARSVGAILVAEGIETSAELAALRRLGVQAGQGYHLGRPEPLQRSGEPEVAEPVALGNRMRAAVGGVADAAASFTWRRRRGGGSAARRFALVLTGALVLGPATFAYAENSMPGSPGYWLKRRVEDVRLVIALDPDTDVRLRLQFAQRRLTEFERLVAEGRPKAAATVLDDYRRQIDSVGRALHKGSSVPSHLSDWAGREIADYLVALERDLPEICAGSKRPADGSCEPIEDATARSKETLERIGQPAHPRSPDATRKPPTKPSGAAQAPSGSQPKAKKS